MQWKCNICSEEHRGEKGLFLAPDLVFTSRIIPLETVDLHAYKTVKALRGCLWLALIIKSPVRRDLTLWGTLDFWLRKIVRFGFITINEPVQNFACVWSSCCFSLWTCLVKRYFCDVHCSKWIHSVMYKYWNVGQEILQQYCIFKLF